MSEDRRSLALTYAWKWVGTFYSWGGDDPAGFDCSGFVCEVLQSVGVLGRKTDFTAEGLRQLFAGKARATPVAGCLLFRGDPAVHVELVVATLGDVPLTIGASGGGSKTITKEDAIRDNAFVKLRPWSGAWSACVDPFA